MNEKDGIKRLDIKAEARKKLKQLMEKHPMPYAKWCDIFDNIWAEIDRKESDFAYCPYCGCDEALITSKSETEAEKGMVIGCPACGKVCKVLIIDDVSKEE